MDYAYKRYKATVRNQQSKLIFPEEDCIEAGEPTPAEGDPIDKLSLEARLELKEEITFQQRLKNEKQVLAQVKQIIEARIEYNQNWLAGLNDGSLTVDDFIKTFFNFDKFRAVSLARQNIIRSNTAEYMRDTIQSDIQVYTDMLNKLSNNSKYLLEVLYLNSHKQYTLITNDRQNGMDNKDTSEARYFGEIMGMLEPFLTAELHDFCKRSHIFVYEERYSHSMKSQFLTKDILMVNRELLKQCAQKLGAFDELRAVQPKLVRKIWEEQQRAAGILGSVRNLVVLESAEVARLDEQVKLQRAIIDLSATSVFTSIRQNFTVLYNCWRELEEFEKWVKATAIAAKKKRQARAIAARNRDLQPKQTSLERESEASAAASAEIIYDTIPVLDDSFFAATTEQQDQEEGRAYAGAAAASSGASSHAVASSETSAEDELEVFYQEKRQQLELWKSIIVQRREQNELEERALHTYFNSAQAAFADSMTVESATRIQDLYNKLSAENQRLLQSLFIDGHQAASAAAVPHNIRFAEIILLIEGCGGSIIRKHGSHFAIKLPNTYCISSADACMQRNTLTYLDLPIVTMGGSFQPHGGGDEWCLAAHKLCRKAFEKAGITMERIKAAKNLFAGRPRAACQP